MGDEEGQIPIRKLQRNLMRLPRNLKARRSPTSISGSALPQSLQAPKAPMPRTGRMPEAAPPPVP